MKHFFNILIICSLFSVIMTAQEGYRIKVDLANYEQEELYLGYYYGDKQYLKDTATVNEQGQFVFEGEEELLPGVYIIVMPPDNSFFQVLINQGEQQLNMATDAKQPNEKMTVKGSPENELLYSYMNYLAAQRPKAEALRQQAEDLTKDSPEAKALEQQQEQLNIDVKNYQKKLTTDHPKSLTAALIRANMGYENMPTYTGDEQEVQMKNWRWMQKHYFDNIDLTDERMLRSPVLFQRVDHYVNKMVVQHPDTISKALDFVLQKMQPTEEVFKYYLIHFLNAYAKSKIVGMDAVYVHLALNYYEKGLAPWTETEQLEKIIDNAKTLEPLLIGKIAPDLKLQKLDVAETLKLKDQESEHRRFKVGEPITLHGVQSPYTILLFWASDCGHCKKAMPKLVEFYDKFKDKGVEILSICTKTYKDVPACAELLMEHNALQWINAVDPYHRSHFGKVYDVRSTPQVYVLDDKKEIISKRIDAEQLEEVMNQIIEMKEKAAEKEGVNGK